MPKQDPEALRTVTDRAEGIPSGNKVTDTILATFIHRDFYRTRMATDPRSIVLFDGVCNFCNASVNFLIDRDPDARYVFGALQSEEGLSVLREHDLPENYFDSIVLIEGDEVWTASDAVLEISKHMSGPWPVLSVFKIIPRAIRDAVYNWIAANRYTWFGKQDTCRLPTPEYRARFL